MLFDETPDIGWGQNGGFQAINLACRFGAAEILLVGFDCSIEKGVHFHGSHPSPLTNPKQGSVDQWRAFLDAAAPALAAAGVQVINCSHHSRLAAFERRPLLEALSCPRSPSTTATTSSAIA